MSKIYENLKELQEKMRRKSPGRAQERRGEEQTRAYIQKRRIRWDPVLEATSYVVYVSRDRTVFDPKNFEWKATRGVKFRAVTGKTELILPDEWPEFPRQQGIYYIGVTAKDEVGNESSPVVSEGLFKFIPPQPPSNVWIESL